MPIQLFNYDHPTPGSPLTAWKIALILTWKGYVSVIGPRILHMIGIKIKTNETENVIEYISLQSRLEMSSRMASKIALPCRWWCQMNSQRYRFVVEGCLSSIFLFLCFADNSQQHRRCHQSQLVVFVHHQIYFVSLQAHPGQLQLSSFAV